LLAGVGSCVILRGFKERGQGDNKKRKKKIIGKFSGNLKVLGSRNRRQQKMIEWPGLLGGGKRKEPGQTFS